MKYCAQFSNKIKLNNFDEIIIQYDAQDEYLLKFFDSHPNKRIILSVNDIEEFYNAQEWRKLNAIHDQYPEYNFAVRFFNLRVFSIDKEEILTTCMDNLEVPYFTGYHVTNFDQLHYLLSKGVSDVYLVENMCFDLRRAKRLCNSAGVQIRTFPNIAQANVNSSPALKKFFIRPEDIKYYEECIDTLEFWGPADRQEILLYIYQKGVWYGDLKDLILDFDLSFDSRRILPGFAQARIDCKRKCMAGDRCSICDKMLSISKQLEDKNLIIKTKKNN